MSFSPFTEGGFGSFFSGSRQLRNILGSGEVVTSLPGASSTAVIEPDGKLPQMGNGVTEGVFARLTLPRLVAFMSCHQTTVVDSPPTASPGRSST